MNSSEKSFTRPALKLKLVFLISATLLLALAILPARAAPATNQSAFNTAGVANGPGLVEPSVALTFTPVATIYLPLVHGSNAPVPPIDNWLAYVNYYRSLVGVPSVTDNTTLNDNCFQHARYMAENNDLTHDQNPSLPWASPAGQDCAQNGNVWLGSEFITPIWQPYHSIDGWMGSVGHRLWLLYPTTPTFGYGFYTAANNRAGAALDVLSLADFSADTSYIGWPIVYPTPGQLSVPATQYSITLNWRYFGPTPTIASTSLTTIGGTPIAHTANTSLPADHKGIQILPSAPLPDDTVFVVAVSGTYDGTSFSYTWSFSTGASPIP